MQHLLAELRRRHVFKVTASYLVGMWIVLQVAQVTFAPLRFPDWWMTALTILAVIGLPIVLVLAWTYEITPEGVVLDAGVDGTGVVRRLPRPRQSIGPVIVAGVALMATVTGFAWWRSLDVPATSGAKPVPPLEPGPRSIAVLPLVDMSAGGGNTYLGDGLSEELSTQARADTGNARGSSHVRLRVQGQEPRRPQDRPVAGRAARARRQRASQWRQRAGDGAVDRHGDRLPRVGRQFRYAPGATSWNCRTTSPSR